MESRPTAEREKDALFTLAVGGVAAALSVAVTGYVFGVKNNLFHLGIVAALFDEPQFRSDAFMQSLRHFAAGPFLLLQGADRWVSPFWLFLTLHYASRFLSLVGFLACAELLGVSSRPQRAIFAVLICLTSILQSYSFAGGGGLFIEYFTHSEIANGLTLFVLWFAARGRIALACAVNGLVFLTNAFMAVWNAAPLALMIGLLVARGRLSPGLAARDGAIGLALFLGISAPVIRAVLANPDFGVPFGDGDYRQFLAEYWPFHFLGQWTTARQWLGLAATIMTGLLALGALRRGAGPFRAALAGYTIIYGLGLIAPWVTGSPAILNLHLLRASAGIHLMAALAAAALTTLWMTSRTPREALVSGPVLAVLLCAPRFALPLIPPALLLLRSLSFAPPRPLTQRKSFVQACVGAGLVACALWLSVQNHRQRVGQTAEVDRWTALGNWARAATSPDALFLLPTSNLRDDFLLGAAAPDVGAGGSDIFEYASHRRVWVDFRRGAAVMWSPSYVHVWRPRIYEVLRLHRFDDKLAYAATHGVTHMIENCAAAGAITTNPAFRVADLCVWTAPARVARGGQP